MGCTVQKLGDTCVLTKLQEGQTIYQQTGVMGVICDEGRSGMSWSSNSTAGKGVGLSTARNVSDYHGGCGCI